MTDQNSQFFAILTAVGEAKQANADALGIPWTFSEMAVGDANGTDPMPDRLQTSLLNEWRRSPLNQLSVDPKNPNVIVAEQVIPAEVGGKWIREIGLYDSAGDLVAIANCPPSYKPLLSQGSGRTQTVRMNLIVSGTANIELKIDPSVVLATRAYVEQRLVDEVSKLGSKKTVRVATAAPITLSGIQSIDGISIVSGNRVLVKNQDVASANGIYIATDGAWYRAADASTNAYITSGLLVGVEEGNRNENTLWQLVTDGVINLGITSLVFEVIYNGAQIDGMLSKKASIDSPHFMNYPESPTQSQFDASNLLANTDFVQRALGNRRGVRYYNESGTLEAEDAGCEIMINIPSGGIVVMPDASVFPSGVEFELFNWGSDAVTVATPVDGVVFNALISSGLSSFVLAPSSAVRIIKENAASWLLPNFSDGRLYKVMLFDASHLYFPSLAAKKIEVGIVGAGAAGGGFTALTAGQMGTGGGGGAGAYCHTLLSITDAMRVNGIQITIGKGAVGGAGVGAPGGTSSFGPYISATGGSGGGTAVLANAGAIGAAVGGLGGIASGGNMAGRSGNEGRPGFALNGYQVSGSGGNSAIGNGGAYGGGSLISGRPGARGGGGGGACYTLPGIACTGGDGGDGCCEIREYY